MITQQLPHQHASGEDEERKTPLRGEGQRRLSAEVQPSTIAAGGVAAGPSTQPTYPQQSQLRNGGIRRKPVPSVVMEDPAAGRRISPTMAQSSAAKEINRERDAPTPGVDDTPYVHFALDQLTRDEEVRGSRRYPDNVGYNTLNTEPAGNVAYGDVAASRATGDLAEGRNATFAMPVVLPQQQQRYEQVPQEEEKDMDVLPVRSPVRPSYETYSQPQSRAGIPPGQAGQGQGLFIPVAQEDSQQPPLHFVPGILRKLALGLFIVALLAYLVCLIIAAAWSRTNRGMGLTPYDGFADGKYFVFRYLPTILGMGILIWLFQIVAAVYRIAPFIAMSSTTSTSSRLNGAKLPLQPRSWLRPYFGHFGARMPVVGTFLLLAWLQIFTIPLLASSFNVHQDSNSNWHWIAVQGVIWVVIALYILLLIASIILLFSIGRRTTGLKWDPRSLADMIVLLERSNALDGEGETVPQLGYFRTTNRPNDVFHAYGIADKPGRSYEVHDGRLQEKRYSDPEMDIEAGRHSKDAFIPHDQHSEDGHPTGSPLPWFLKPFFALLWPIIAIVFLLAFLIVSYLPSTTVRNGFDPMIGAAVDVFGFSGTNFLYSFIPALLATIAFLGWYDIDLAYRRLTPFESLTAANGDVAEKTLLPSYTADIPVLTSLSALVNGHYRMAFISIITLLSIAIPILAGGVFWAQFYIAQQRVRISADMPAYIALSVFVTIYGLAYFAIYPSRSLRTSGLPKNLDTFAGIKDCFQHSRLLDEFAFRNPVGKIDLVTRLLSYSAPQRSMQEKSDIVRPDANASKVSLADSIRGFGRARAQAATIPVPRSHGVARGETAKYAYGRIQGRDWREWTGVDLVREV